MPKVHTVKSARNPIPSVGVKKGDTYYWWKFRYGGKRVSKVYPKRSQLTQSEFLSAYYELLERLDTLDPAAYMDDPASLRSDLEDIASEIRQLGDDQRDKRENMPEQLQDGDTGTLLEERADGCESWADELEGIDVDAPYRDDFAEGDDGDDDFAEAMR